MGGGRVAESETNLEFSECLTIGGGFLCPSRVETDFWVGHGPLPRARHLTDAVSVRIVSASLPRISSTTSGHGPRAPWTSWSDSQRQTERFPITKT